MQQWYQCPQCGAPVTFGTEFCGSCGTKIVWPAQQQPPPQYQQYQQTPRYQQAYQQQIPQQRIIPNSITGGGIVCVHCGSHVIPVKGKFGWGWFILWIILGVFPAIIYLFYHAGKRADRCPICNKKAYK